MPIDARRVEDRNFRGEGRTPNDSRPANYRERNDRVERGDRMMDRGRQSPTAQRSDRDRFDRRHTDVDMPRRDRREDAAAAANQPEWRGRDRPQGKFK